MIRVSWMEKVKHSELAVVEPDELRKIGIGILVIVDLPQTQFLHQAILEGLVGTLNPTFSLGRIGTNELNTQETQRAAELGNGLLMDTGGRIHAENAEFIAVEGHRQASGPEIGPEVGLAEPGVGKEALMVDKLSGQYLTGSSTGGDKLWVRVPPTRHGRNRRFEPVPPAVRGARVGAGLFSFS